MFTEYQIKEKLLNEYGTKVTYMEFYREEVHIMRLCCMVWCLI